MTRPLLALVAMFKDEADSVRALMESVRVHVDQWVVLDTGSTDGTQAIVCDAMVGLPGEVVEREPILYQLKRGARVFDFASNRNRALDLAGNSERPVFTIFLSGHETLRGGEALRTFLEAHRDDEDGAYMVRVQSGNREFDYTRVLRVDAGWQYSGVIHELPEGPGGTMAAELIPGVTIVHAPTDADRKRKRLLEHDLPVLEEAVADENIPLTKRGHSILMLAETNALIARDLRNALVDGNDDPGNAWRSHQLLAMSLYWRYSVLAKDYDAEKSNYAFALYYALASEVDLYSPQELVIRLEAFVVAAPGVPEAWFMLAKFSALIDARIGLKHALSAHETARAVQAAPRRAPLDPTLVWRSLLLASACADAQSKGAKAMEDRIKRAAVARRLLEQAVKFGAPKNYLDDSQSEAAP